MWLGTPRYFALACLIYVPLHGNGIVHRASPRSHGVVQLSTDTLYALLERAIAEVLVFAGEPYMQGGRRRRDYALTPAGRLALDVEARRLERVGRLVTRRLR